MQVTGIMEILMNRFKEGDTSYHSFHFNCVLLALWIISLQILTQIHIYIKSALNQPCLLFFLLLFFSKLKNITASQSFYFK